MTLMNSFDLSQAALLPGKPTFDARALTGDDGLAQIVLDEKVYTLRITRAGKLILTK
jgi:hemin uptake protein HemP